MPSVIYKVRFIFIRVSCDEFCLKALTHLHAFLAFLCPIYLVKQVSWWILNMNRCVLCLLFMLLLWSISLWKWTFYGLRENLKLIVKFCLCWTKLFKHTDRKHFILIFRQVQWKRIDIWRWVQVPRCVLYKQKNLISRVAVLLLKNKTCSPCWFIFFCWVHVDVRDMCNASWYM